MRCHVLSAVIHIAIRVLIAGCRVLRKIRSVIILRLSIRIIVVTAFTMSAVQAAMQAHGVRATPAVHGVRRLVGTLAA